MRLLALSPCGLATYDMQTEMSSSPTGGLCLPAGKHTGILTQYQTQSTKKWTKSNFFLAALFLSEIRTLSPIIYLKNAEFLALAGIEVLSGLCWKFLMDIDNLFYKLTAFGGTFLATLPIFAIITNSYTIKLVVIRVKKNT